MGELMGYVDQITSYGFSSTDLGNKAVNTRYLCVLFNILVSVMNIIAVLKWAFLTLPSISWF